MCVCVRTLGAVLAGAARCSHAFISNAMAGARTAVLSELVARLREIYKRFEFSRAFSIASTLMSQRRHSLPPPQALQRKGLGTRTVGKDRRARSLCGCLSTCSVSVRLFGSLSPSWSVPARAA